MKKTNPGLCVTIGFVLLCAVCATTAGNPAEDAQTTFQRGLTALSQNNYVDIRDASSRRVGYIDGSIIRDASSSRIGYIDGNATRIQTGAAGLALLKIF
jgi:hypothetical protein